MKSTFTILSILFFITTVFSQSRFQSGYFINSEGNKTVCLIKNKDWKENPTEIEYKSTLSSDIQKIGINNLREFGIDGFSKFEKHIVIVDKFDESTIDYNLELNTDYHKDTVLLKVLVEGNASLYFYEGSKFRRYFFSTENLSPEQLIYKTFKRYDPKGGINKLINTKLEYNRVYRLQLYEHLKCTEITPETIVKVKFNKKSLIEFFNTYNYCQGSESLNYYKLEKRDLFNFKARFGIGLTKLDAVNRRFNSFNFTNRISYKIGFEAEHVLPYRNGRWSLTLEPSFVRISQSDSVSTASIGTINYNAIQVSFGLRYNHHLSPKTRLYGTILHAPEFVFSSTVKRGPFNVFKLQSLNNFIIKDYAVGIGLLKNKWNAEIRHHFRRRFSQINGGDLEYGVTYLIIGYQI